MGKFAEKAAEILKQAEPWENTLNAQRQKLHSVIPSAEDEAMTRAKELLSKLQGLAYQSGYGLRENTPRPGLDGAPDALGMPHREKMINIPALPPKTAEWLEPRLFSKEALLGFLTDPIKNKLEESALGLRSTLDEKREHGMRVTGDPLTIPTFLPAAALSVPKSFIEGYRASDKSQLDRRQMEMDSRLQKARDEFETALKDEYASSRSKAASAGELIDGLAQWWIDGQTKEADGEINKAMGMYLAAAGLLGAGSHTAVKSLWEKRDPRYQKYKAMQELIKARQRHSALPVLVTEEHIPAEQQQEGEGAFPAPPPGLPEDGPSIENLPQAAETDDPNSLDEKIASIGLAINLAGNEIASDLADHISTKMRKRAKRVPRKAK